MLVAGGVAFLVLLAVGAILLVRTAPLDAVSHAVRDRDGKHVHVFGTHTVMPDDGDSVTTYHYYVIDGDTLASHAGDHRCGDGLDLEGDFVTSSVATMSTRLGTPLALDAEAKPSLQIWQRDDAPPPADGIVVWRMSETPPRLEVELRRRGERVCRGTLPAMNTPEVMVELPGERFLLFYTRRAMGVRIGAGYAVLSDVGLEDRGFFRRRARRAPRLASA